MDQHYNEKHTATGNDESESKNSQLTPISEPTDSQEPSPPRNINGALWAVAVLSIMSSTFLFALDNTVTANVQEAVLQRFDGVSRLPWISVAYLLGAATINLFWYASCALLYLL